MGLVSRYWGLVSICNEKCGGNNCLHIPVMQSFLSSMNPLNLFPKHRHLPANCTFAFGRGFKPSVIGSLVEVSDTEIASKPYKNQAQLSTRHGRRKKVLNNRSALPRHQLTQPPEDCLSIISIIVCLLSETDVFGTTRVARGL